MENLFWNAPLGGDPSNYVPSWGFLSQIQTPVVNRWSDWDSLDHKAHVQGKSGTSVNSSTINFPKRKTQGLLTEVRTINDRCQFL